jgi:hypothetical protein
LIGSPEFCQRAGARPYPGECQRFAAGAGSANAGLWPVAFRSSGDFREAFGGGEPPAA